MLQSFGESDGALVVSADMTDSQFEEFKALAEDTNEVAFLPAIAIPFILIEGTKVLAITAASLGIIKAASNIQDLLADSRVEKFIPEDVDTSTEPFDLGEATKIDLEKFPGRNDFLKDIVNGKFEFPDGEEGGSYFLAAGTDELIGELADAGIKHNPENIVEIDKAPSGKIIFLETGNDSAGLQHIVKEHGTDFANKGISEGEISDVVISAVTEGKIVGTTGKDRSIYETSVNGETKYIAVSVGSNGFIVGANPVSKP